MLTAASALLLCAGCGSGYNMAEVSGVVTLDGKPLSNATILFMPKATAGNDAGPPSNATTDENGKYTLTTAESGSGAMVGKHQVQVFTVSDQPTGEGEGGDNVYSKANAEKLPAHYNTASTLTFDVPAGGTSEANFELKSK